MGRHEMRGLEIGHASDQDRGIPPPQKAVLVDERDEPQLGDALQPRSCAPVIIVVARHEVDAERRLEAPQDFDGAPQLLDGSIREISCYRDEIGFR